MPDRVIEGPPGIDGASAYEIAVALGFKGTPDEWVASLRGLDGRDGRDGVDGKDGRDGIDGKDGTNGRDGVDGRDGQNGRDGIDGKDAPAPVKQPWRGDFTRDADGRTVLLQVSSEDGREAWNLIPKRREYAIGGGSASLMESVSIVPVA